MRLTDKELTEALTNSRTEREPSELEKKVRSVYGRGLPLISIIMAFGLRSSQVVQILGLKLDPIEFHNLETEADAIRNNQWSE